MLERPNYLIQGEQARLIPVGKDAKKERGVTSVFLASLMAVDEFAQELLRAVGVRVGSRARISAFTEVVFKNATGEKELRPDGLLIVATGKREWRALIEAKIGKNEISDDQIIEYLKVAKANGIDAVITISNQFAHIPTHHPVKVNKVQQKMARLYHWSWTYVATQALVLIKENKLADVDQTFILKEVVRFLDHPDTGVLSFDRMDRSWNDLVRAVKNSATPKRTSLEVENSIGSWHQEERDLCLKLSQKLGCFATIKTPRAHIKDPVLRFKAACEQLSTKAILQCDLEIPYATAMINVCADLRRTTVSCSMRLAAPHDRKRPSARVNWLLRQFPESAAENIQIRAIWPGRTPDTQAFLGDIRDNMAALVPDGSSSPPSTFDVLMVNDMGFCRFSSPKNFIVEVETTVHSFYEHVAQNLQAWFPPPLKIASEPEILAAAEETA